MLKITVESWSVIVLRGNIIIDYHGILHWKGALKYVLKADQVLTYPFSANNGHGYKLI